MRIGISICVSTALIIGLPTLTAGQAPPAKQDVVVTRSAGGSIQTYLSASSIVNNESSVSREWLALHDPNMPADLIDTPGVTTIYQSDQIRDGYYYVAKLSVHARKDLAALEVRFLVFDVWGQHVRTLLSDDVADVPAGATKKLSPQWRVLSENEVSRHYASIGYISRVRTKDGLVIEADPAAVVREAQKFSKRFTAADLEPKEAR